MKKGLFVLTFLLSIVFCMPVGSFADSSDKSLFGLTVKGGFDFMGESTTNFEGYGGYDEETGDVDTGLSVAAEAYVNLNVLMLGIGAGYLFPRGIDEDWPDGKFSRTPMYVFVNIPFASADYTPFLAVHVGYSELTFDTDMIDWWETETGGIVLEEGGLYWALGGGVILNNNLQFELLYRSHSGSFSITQLSASEEFDTEYTQLTLSIGYRFW